MSEHGVLVRGARLFDGVRVEPSASVLVAEGRIEAVLPGAVEPPPGVEVVNGTGKTLLPGLIDAHVHAKPGAPEQALAFGVTTELDMGSDPEWMSLLRADSARSDVADVRSSSFGCTVLDGWPSGAIGTFFPRPFPVIAEVADVPSFVEARVAEGADYVKLFIDDGGALGLDVPTMTPAMSTAVVAEAHRRGLLAIAHAMTAHGARQAVESGADGLAHIFSDAVCTPDLVSVIRDAGMFVIATLCAVGAMTGGLTGAALVGDPRTAGLIDDEWSANLCGCGDPDVPGDIENARRNVRALHAAGVDILAGTDSACVGVLGVAHGVSLHGELQLLAGSGLAPTQALAAATSVPARRFGLDDRGRIAPGLRADLVLVDGDPTTSIADTLSIDSIWRGGRLLDRGAYRRRIADAAGLAGAVG